MKPTPNSIIHVRNAFVARTTAAPYAKWLRDEGAIELKPTLHGFLDNFFYTLGEMLEGDRRDAEVMKRLTGIQALEQEAFKYLRPFPWLALPTAALLISDQQDMFLD